MLASIISNDTNTAIVHCYSCQQVETDPYQSRARIVPLIIFSRVSDMLLAGVFFSPFVGFAQLGTLL